MSAFYGRDVKVPASVSPAHACNINYSTFLFSNQHILYRLFNNFQHWDISQFFSLINKVHSISLFRHTASKFKNKSILFLSYFFFHFKYIIDLKMIMVNQLKLCQNIKKPAKRINSNIFLKNDASCFCFKNDFDIIKFYQVVLMVRSKFTPSSS